MANIKDLIQSIESGDSSFDEKLAAINAMEETLVAMRAQEQEAIDDNVSLIVEAIKVMERKVEAQLEVARAIVPEKGDKGERGRDGQNGRDGLNGKDGLNGQNGKDGQDGADGVSVTDAKIDFDGSLVIVLSTGREINVGEVVAPDLAEKIKLVTSGGGTSQQVLDTLASLQTQIDNLIPSQTGNAGKYLTTDGTNTSWATVAGGGAVDSVNGQTGVVVLDADDVGALPTTGGTVTGPTVVSMSSTSTALRVTQTGTGSALVVEDSSNPDSSPFVVSATGNVGLGTSAPSVKLEVIGTGYFSNNLFVDGLFSAGNTIESTAGGFVFPDATTQTTAASAIAVSDEGTQLTPAATSLNFTGAGVTATNTGGAVTVNIAGGGGGVTIDDVIAFSIAL
jgi:hypothetical protein